MTLPSRPTSVPRRLPVGATWRGRALWSSALALALLSAIAVFSAGRAGDNRDINPNQSVLSDNEVARLFDRPLPGLSEPKRIPKATGHKRADKRIAQVARSRGYVRRGNPLDALGFYQGRGLQQQAIDDLIDLQAAMAGEIGVGLTLTSGHRGPAHQRRLFISQLTTSSVALRGRVVTNNEIALGLVDEVLNHAMGRAAPPGFSRHHTGLTIDVASEGQALFAFANSRAYRWLTGDGYANAMAFGWIPSYPAGASGLGPDPEPWEWVWIGRDLAACAREGSCTSGAVDGIDINAVGWALSSDGSPAAALRLLTAAGTRRLDPTTVARFDVATAFGVDEAVGFSAAVGALDEQRWACVEARADDGARWNRVGCAELE